MPRDKRTRFRASYYLARIDEMGSRISWWCGEYQQLAEEVPGEWLQQQLLRRARLADDVWHHLAHANAIICELVQTPLSRPTPAASGGREDRGSEIVPGSATEDVSLSGCAASGYSTEPESQPRPRPRRLSGGTRRLPAKPQSQ